MSPCWLRCASRRDRGGVDDRERLDRFRSRASAGQTAADLRAHNFARLLRRGVAVTINSDDPAYFGGYIADNYRATAAALDLTAAELVAVAENAARASFLPATAKAALLGRIRQVAARA